MDLKGIAAISGKEGLYKIVKPTRTGMIVENLSDSKQRLAVGSNGKVSVLEDISIYTEGDRESVPLPEVFIDIHKKFGLTIPVTAKSTPEELKNFLEMLLPDYDKERVYVSDIKKLVVWYELLCRTSSELFTETPKEEKPSETKAAKDRSDKKKVASEKSEIKKDTSEAKTKKAGPKKKPKETGS